MIHLNPETDIAKSDECGIINEDDKEENDFVIENPEKGIFTMFKPDEGITYFNYRKNEEEELSNNQ